VTETDTLINVLLIADNPVEAARIGEFLSTPGKPPAYKLEWVSTFEDGSKGRQ
jgi:hypothetical protein